MIFGLGDNDWIFAGAGTNHLFGDAGNDMFGGDAGTDRFVVTSPGDRVVAMLVAGTVTGGYGNGSTLTTIEAVSARDARFAVENRSICWADATQVVPVQPATTVCSMAPKMLWWRSSCMSMRTVSPGASQAVAGAPDTMVSTMRCSAMQA